MSRIGRLPIVLTAIILAVALPSRGLQAQSVREYDRCDEVILKHIGKHFHLSDFSYPASGRYPSVENGGLIVAGKCKMAPTIHSRVIAAFAYDSGLVGEKDLLIAIYDRQSNKVVSSYSYKYTEDPGGIGSLRIDTAPYRLSSNVRAFALDIEPGYSPNCGDGGGGPERTLYVEEGSRIRPVLHISSLSSWTFIKGNKPGCGPDSDEEIIENIGLSIEVANSVTNGYRDLVVTATSARTDGKPAGKGKYRHKLQYDGREYPTEAMTNSYYKWLGGGREP